MNFYETAIKYSFPPDFKAEMPDGSMKKVSDLRIGDKVKTPNGTSEIIDIYIIENYSGLFRAFASGNIMETIVTLNHPCRYKNEEFSPEKKEGLTIKVKFKYMYGFILSDEKVLLNDDYEFYTI